MSVVLRGRGGTFRLGDNDIEVVRLGRTWRVPLRAVTGHGRDGRAVRVETARRRFEVVGRNDAGTDAFARALDKALHDLRPDPEAEIRAPARNTKLGLWLGAGLVFVLVLVTIGLFLTVVAVVLCVVAYAGVRMGRAIWRGILQDLWVLRRHGVTVRGELVEYRENRHDMTKHPRLRFTTVTGRDMDVRSPVFVLLRRPLGPVDVTYWPKDPDIARGGGAYAHLFAGLLGMLVPAALVLLPVVFVVYAVILL